MTTLTSDITKGCFCSRYPRKYAHTHTDQKQSLLSSTLTRIVTERREGICEKRREREQKEVEEREKRRGGGRGEREWGENG